ncbi:MAG: hypothetical protein J0L84_19455, partial [Verrucomicrobia bacterium]|nr:hypothetical protein [Verrucomicrobiota bacterium]
RLVHDEDAPPGDAMEERADVMPKTKAAEYEDRVVPQFDALGQISFPSLMMAASPSRGPAQTSAAKEA